MPRPAPGGLNGDLKPRGTAGRQGTTVTGHSPARTSRTATEPTNRWPALADAPTTTASARTSPATRRSSENASPRLGHEGGGDAPLPGAFDLAAQVVAGLVERLVVGDSHRATSTGHGGGQRGHRPDVNDH